MTHDPVISEAIRTELFNPRALIVFGTYTIGKERLWLEVGGGVPESSCASRQCQTAMPGGPIQAPLMWPMPP